MSDDITKELFECVADELGAEYHEAYSGRCMYGETVPAISGDIDPMRLGFEFARVATTELGMSFAEAEAHMPHRIDSLGMGQIFY